MQQYTSCLRCNRLVHISADGADIEEIHIAAEEAVVAIICVDCLSAEEADRFRRQAIVEVIGTIEMALDNLTMLFERCPELVNDPESMRQRHYAEAQLAYWAEQLEEER